MAIKQTDRGLNYITINVSGMSNELSDRQTWLVLPEAVEGMAAGISVTLEQAKTFNIIDSYYVEDINDNNGDIAIYFKSGWAEKQKVWIFKIDSLYKNTGTVRTSYTIPAVLKFEYDNSSEKKPGEAIDVTAEDARRLNLFGSQIDKLICGGAGSMPAGIESAAKGSPIKAEYIVKAAENILNFANQGDYHLCYAPHPNFGELRKGLDNIVIYCKSGSEVKAEYFNNLKYVINNLNIQKDF